MHCWEGVKREMSLVAFVNFLQTFDKCFQQKISHFHLKEARLKPGNQQNLIGHTGNKARQF